MGRIRTKHKNLPDGMYARVRRGKTYYSMQVCASPRREVALGTDYIAAVRKWADLTQRPRPLAARYTFLDLMLVYRIRVLPGKAVRTRQDNEKELVWLMRFFGDPPAPLDEVRPLHIRQYMEWRVQEAYKAAERRNATRAKPLPIPTTIGQVRANRERALFSTMWNYARQIGYTDAPNPCDGVKNFREKGRDIVISDAQLAAVMQHAGKPLQFALRLALLTGQRPGDVLRMSESHCADGVLHIQQGKTRAKLRIEITGELAVLLEEIRQYKAGIPNAHSPALLVNERGHALTANMFRCRFDAAREAAGIEKASFQFRDLRATAATSLDEEAGLRQAQALLGHANESMTEHYVRHKAGRKVRPLK